MNIQVCYFDFYFYCLCYTACSNSPTTDTLAALQNAIKKWCIFVLLRKSKYIHLKLI